MQFNTCGTQCCRGDNKQDNIREIVKLLQVIQRDLIQIQDAINYNSPIDGPAKNLLNFKNIALTRYYANEILDQSEFIKQLTMRLERDIIRDDKSNNS
jgi:hypothetical protein